jgi:ferrous iron transport protein A
MALGDSLVGCWLRIIGLPRGMYRAQFVRLGLSEGERILCLERLPGGTVVIQKRRQQIALGFALAREVLVIPAAETEETGG